MQLLNSSVAGSDAFFDAILQDNVSAPAGPTPGFPNGVFSTDVPPQIRKVGHSPVQPAGGQDVTITALITDPDGVSSASLDYQVIRAGGYIPITDPTYSLCNEARGNRGCCERIATRFESRLRKAGAYSGYEVVRGF